MDELQFKVYIVWSLQKRILVLNWCIELFIYWIQIHRIHTQVNITKHRHQIESLISNWIICLLNTDTPHTHWSRTYSRNLGQHSILARKGTFFNGKRAIFMKKEHPPTPYSIPFLSVLYHIKLCIIFEKERSVR